MALTVDKKQRSYKKTTRVEARPAASGYCAAARPSEAGALALGACPAAVLYYSVGGQEPDAARAREQLGEGLRGLFPRGFVHIAILAQGFLPTTGTQLKSSSKMGDTLEGFFPAIRGEKDHEGLGAEFQYSGGNPSSVRAFFLSKPPLDLMVAYIIYTLAALRFGTKAAKEGGPKVATLIGCPPAVRDLLCSGEPTRCSMTPRETAFCNVGRHIYY